MKAFSEALGDLLAEYADTDVETLISELELQIDALKEQATIALEARGD